MPEYQDKANLDQRTRLRNGTLWVNLDWGGLMTPLDDQQTAVNFLSQAAIENFMEISDETWGIKESQRDRTGQIDQYAVNQDRFLTGQKVSLGKAKLAIQQTTDEYVTAVMVYEAKVKALLMGAREYAARVELEQLDIERQRAILAVSKEQLHLTQVNAQIFYETINRAMVEADIAKSQVEVAKANVRALMADIQAGEAEIKVIQAQTQVYIEEANKAMLQAQVAQIYAQIMVKQLSAVKLAVSQAEIQAGFAYIASKMTDMLQIWNERLLIQNLKTEVEGQLLAETNLMLADEKASEDLRETEMQNQQAVQSYVETQTYDNIDRETALKQTRVAAHEALQDARMNAEIAKDNLKTWADALINATQRWVYLNTFHQYIEHSTNVDSSIVLDRINEYISTGG